MKELILILATIIAVKVFDRMADYTTTADSLNQPGSSYAKLISGKAWFTKDSDRIPPEGCTVTVHGALRCGGEG